MDKLGGGYSREGYHQLEREFDRQRAEERYEQQKAENIKTAKKVAIGGAILTSVAGLSIGGAVVGDKISEKNAREAAEIVSNYDNDIILDNPNDEELIVYGNNIKLINNIPKLVECSNKLNELDLDKYEDINCFNETIDYKDPEKVNQLIEQYETLEKSVKHSDLTDIVGDDVVTFNHLVYELKGLEKIYNQEIYNSYGYLEDYGLESTKLYLSDIYGGKPEQYNVSFNNYHHKDYPEITGPGIDYHDGFDSDLLEYTKTLNEVYRAHNTPSNVASDEYNKDRNDVVLNAITKYNVNGANVINDIKKQQKKDLKKSQEHFEEMSGIKSR